MQLWKQTQNTWIAFRSGQKCAVWNFSVEKISAIPPKLMVFYKRQGGLCETCYILYRWQPLEIFSGNIMGQYEQSLCSKMKKLDFTRQHLGPSVPALVPLGMGTLKILKINNCCEKSKQQLNHNGVARHSWSVIGWRIWVNNLSGFHCHQFTAILFCWHSLSPSPLISLFLPSDSCTYMQLTCKEMHTPTHTRLHTCAHTHTPASITAWLTSVEK